MAAKKAKPPKLEAKKANVPDPKKTGYYKSYDIYWLEKEPEHPDYYLVAEFYKKFGKKEK